MTSSNSELECILEEVAAATWHRPAKPDDDLPSLDPDSWRTLVARASEDVREHIKIVRYRIDLDAGNRSRLMAELDQLPEVRRCLGEAHGGEEVLLFAGPYHQFSFETVSAFLTFLAERLLHRTILLDGRRALNTLRRILDLGSRSELPGLEATFVVGLSKVDRTISDVGEFRVVPFSVVRRELPDLAGWIFDQDVRQWSARHNGPVSALVRGFHWGPLIARGTSRRPTVPTFKLRAETAVDFLSHILRKPLVVAGSTCLTTREYREFIGEIGTTMTFPWPERSPSKASVSSDQWEQFTALCRFATASDDGDTEKRVGLACSRLANSTRRIGPLEYTDQIIDLAIALEALVGDKRSSGKELLATRVAWLLGSGPKDRLKIRESVRRFYRVRSAVVHGSQMSDEKSGMLAEARELVGRLLEEFQSRGGIPTQQDWNEIVLGGE